MNRMAQVVLVYATAIVAACTGMQTKPVAKNTAVQGKLSSRDCSKPEVATLEKQMYGGVVDFGIKDPRHARKIKSATSLVTDCDVILGNQAYNPNDDCVPSVPQIVFDYDRLAISRDAGTSKMYMTVKGHAGLVIPVDPQPSAIDTAYLKGHDNDKNEYYVYIKQSNLVGREELEKQYVVEVFYFDTQSNTIRCQNEEPDWAGARLIGSGQGNTAGGPENKP